MRDTIRDFMNAIGAVAALFAAFQSWSNNGASQVNREELRTEIAALKGTLTTTSNTVIAHVNAAGLHPVRDTQALTAADGR